jgi:hypothetical protein
MLEFFKKLFGAEPVKTTAPYKVEAPALASTSPAPTTRELIESRDDYMPGTKAKKKPVSKKPAAKKTPVRKPRTPKA